MSRLPHVPLTHAGARELGRQLIRSQYPDWAARRREITAGLFIRANLDPMELGEQACNAADRLYPGGCDLREAARKLLDLHGEEPTRDVCRLLTAAFSTATGVDILSDVVGSALMQAYTGDGDTSEGWTTPREVSNFLEQRRTRLDQHLPLGPVPRGKQAPHTQLNVAAAETYKVQRYGSQFKVDEMDIMDDDVSVLTEPARIFGLESLSLKLNLVYSVLLANATLDADSVALFETASHANLATNSPLTSASLAVAVGKMRVQTVEGEPVHPRAAISYRASGIGGTRSGVAA